MSVANDMLTDIGTGASLPGTGWAAARRDAALADYLSRGVPHHRVEDWKYSDLRAALSADAAVSEAAAGNPFAEIHGTRLDLRDGKLTTAIADMPKTVEAFDLADLAGAPDWVQANLGKTGKDGMAAASLALMAGGIALRVHSGVMVEEPVQLAFVSREAHHARVLIVVEDGAALTLLESHAHAASLANLGVEIVLGEKAMLTHIRLAQSPAEAVQVEEVAVTQAAGSTYRGHFSDLGAKLSRLELAIALKGARTETNLSGVQVLSDGRHADVTTRLDHAVGDAESVQLFKHVVAGKSRAVYQGRITVEEGADGTDSRQTAKALLLDANAEADLKPELIIFADDVKCAHGAAVGDLDAESLFYLRSRGIPEAEARGVLMRAFLEDAVSEIENVAIRGAVWTVVEDALVRAEEAA
jgi:Fe-S cluster assembly protein SufD